MAVHHQANMLADRACHLPQVLTGCLACLQVQGPGLAEKEEALASPPHAELASISRDQSWQLKERLRVKAGTDRTVCCLLSTRGPQLPEI